jgi:hypothetical protein
MAVPAKFCVTTFDSTETPLYVAYARQTAVAVAITVSVRFAVARRSNQCQKDYQKNKMYFRSKSGHFISRQRHRAAHNTKFTGAQVLLQPNALLHEAIQN